MRRWLGSCRWPCCCAVRRRSRCSSLVGQADRVRLGGAAGARRVAWSGWCCCAGEGDARPGGRSGPPAEPAAAGPAGDRRAGRAGRRRCCWRSRASSPTWSGLLLLVPPVRRLARAGVQRAAERRVSSMVAGDLFGPRRVRVRRGAPAAPPPVDGDRRRPPPAVDRRGGPIEGEIVEPRPRSAGGRTVRTDGALPCADAPGRVAGRAVVRCVRRGRGGCGPLGAAR